MLFEATYLGFLHGEANEFLEHLSVHPTHVIIMMVVAVVAMDGMALVT